ncbi:hypothetical protein ACQJBY_036811 [Aegilops geniculata]
MQREASEPGFNKNEVGGNPFSSKKANEPAGRVAAKIPKGKEPVTPQYHVLESADVPAAHINLIIVSDDDDEEEEEEANKVAAETNNSSVNIVDPRAVAALAIAPVPPAATSAPAPITPAAGAPMAFATDSATPATYGHGNGAAGVCARGIKRPHAHNAIFAPAPGAGAPVAFVPALATPAASDHGNMGRMAEELQDIEAVSASMARTRTIYRRSVSARSNLPRWGCQGLRTHKTRSAPAHCGLLMKRNTTGPAPAYAGSSSRAPVASGSSFRAPAAKITSSTPGSTFRALSANISSSAPGSSSHAPPAKITSSIPGSSSRAPPAKIISSSSGSSFRALPANISSSAPPANISSSAPGSSSRAPPANVSSSAPGMAMPEQGNGTHGFVRLFGVDIALVRLFGVDIVDIAPRE